MDERQPAPDGSDEVETIAPDLAFGEKRPMAPDEFVRRERDKYGDDSFNANRDDALDEHHGHSEDIV